MFALTLHTLGSKGFVAQGLASELRKLQNGVEERLVDNYFDITNQRDYDES